jgi:hypothetical protein
MHYLHVPLDQLAPDALVGGVLTPEWSGALAKASVRMIKAERSITEAYVKLLASAAAGRRL